MINVPVQHVKKDIITCPSPSHLVTMHIVCTETGIFTLTETGRFLPFCTAASSNVALLMVGDYFGTKTVRPSTHSA